MTDPVTLDTISQQLYVITALLGAIIGILFFK